MSELKEEFRHVTSLLGNGAFQEAAVELSRALHPIGVAVNPYTLLQELIMCRFGKSQVTLVFRSGLVINMEARDGDVLFNVWRVGEEEWYFTCRPAQ